MDNRQEIIKKIKTLLRAHHNGLTITDIAQKLLLNRNSTAKYLEILLISGDVNLNTYGPAKVYTISQRMPISALVKFSADIIILVDNDMRVLDANENALSILGLSRDNLVGNKIETINSPLIERLAIPEVFGEIHLNGEIQREFAITSNNEDRHYRVRLIPTVFDNLEDGVTIIGEDVTKQIRFEESLMVSEARYRAIVQDQTDFICRWRPDGTVTFINEPLGRFLGISCSDACGKSIFSYISSEDLSIVKEKIAGITPEHTTDALELRVINGDGIYRWQAWSNRTIFDHTGTFVECQSVGRDITERRLVEETLTRIRKAVDSSSEAIGISTPDGCHIYQNPAFTNMFGYTQEELTMPFGPVVLFADKKKGNEIFETIMRGDSINGEVIMVSKEGHRFEVSYHADAIRDDQGNIIGLIGIHTDITERKRVEKALSESELLYRTILNNIQDIYYRCDPNGTIVMVSPSAAKLLGYESIDEIIGEKITEKLYFRPEDREFFLKAIYEKQKTTDYEVILKKQDGTPVVISTNSNLLFDSEGRVTGIEGFLRDITFRKNAEKALRESEERYRNVVEDQTEFICRFTPDGTITFLNDAYCRYFGLTKEKCIGNPHNVILPPEDARTMKTHLASLTPENPVNTVEHRILMPDGKIVWHSWSDRAIFNPEGKVIEYQSVGRDITNKMEYVRKIRQSEERFRMIANLSPFPISIMDAGSNYRYLNKMFEHLFGYTLADIPTGKDWFLKAFPDDNERRDAILTWKKDLEHSRAEEVRSRIYLVTCKDGTVRQIQFFPVTMQNGEQFVVYEDLTPKNESERLRSILASIVDSSNDAIIGKTLDGTIISWNAAAERIYGYTADEMIGKSINVLISPELRDQVPFFLERVRNGERIEHFRTTRLHKDGSPIAVSITLSPIRDENGLIYGISTIAKNIIEGNGSDLPGTS